LWFSTSALSGTIPNVGGEYSITFLNITFGTSLISRMTTMNLRYHLFSFSFWNFFSLLLVLLAFIGNIYLIVLNKKKIRLLSIIIASMCIIGGFLIFFVKQFVITNSNWAWTWPPHHHITSGLSLSVSTWIIAFSSIIAGGLLMLNYFLQRKKQHKTAN